MANTTVTVSTSKELYDALAKCTGGETILLEGGDYGSLNLSSKTKFNFDFPSTVTIASADPADPAVFSTVDVQGATNLAFDGITFDYSIPPGGTAIWVKPFVFQGCDGLTIKDCTFDGSLMSATGNPNLDGYAAGKGLSIGASTNVVVEGNEFYEFHTGLSIHNSTSVEVRGNELYEMRSEGMNFSQMTGVVIEDNYIHDFRASVGSGDHPDMIQFWTAGTTKPSTDIIIRDNVLDIGQGSPAQSIFMRNEAVDTGQASFQSMAYRNVLIENNTITNAHTWGINVGEAIGVTISQNTVTHSDGGAVDGADSSVEIPKINVAFSSTGVSIVDNVTSSISGWSNQSTWLVKNNAFVQDQNPLAAGYYADVFVSSSLQAAADGSHHFVALQGGMIDLLGAGSTSIQPDTRGLQTLFQVDETNAATRVFDASISSLNGSALPTGTTYLWDFGDGTTGKGQTVTHSYADGGDYAVTLTVVLSSGVKEKVSMPLSVQDPDILTMDASGRFIAFDCGSTIALGAGKTPTTDGLQLGAPGVSATVARTHVVDVVGADDMAIAFTLDADKAGASGELFRLHGSFVVSVTKAGELQVQIMRDGSSAVTCTTKGAGLNTGMNQDHDIVINLDNGKLQVWVDGQLDGQVGFSGTVGGASSSFNSHSLVFGSPWGAPNFNGDISGFEISVDASDFPPTPQTQVIATGRSSSVAPAPTMVIADLDDGQQPADQPDAVGRAHDPEDARDDAPMGFQDRFLAILEARFDAFAA